jgi:hypothetical protein
MILAFDAPAFAVAAIPMIGVVTVIAASRPGPTKLAVAFRWEHAE